MGTLNRMQQALVAAAMALLGAGACGDGGDGGADAGVGPADASIDAGPAAAVDRDILTTELTLDLATHEGIARIGLAAGAAGASFEIGDLEILAVEQDGVAITFDQPVLGRLDVAAPAGATSIDVRYRFAEHADFDGWDATPGYSLLWPYFCRNLYPCDSRPADGVKFTLAITGVPAAQTAVFPATIPADAPAYMPALSVGAYTYEKLGDTVPGGTEVGLYYLPGGQATALAGGGKLLEYVDFLETTIGPYLFGPKVASVSVAWAGAAYGGMEHHPFWHIAAGAMGDRNVHAHEAAHGWFGNGIRLRCWEDFVLSEGLATYLAARAIAAVDGEAAGEVEWAAYQQRLEAVVASADTPAWPAGECNSIDILTHPVWSSVPYMKGAFFMRAVEAQVGVVMLDLALREFYAAHAGGAAGVQDLLDTIFAETGFDASALAEAWLRGLGIPTRTP